MSYVILEFKSYNIRSVITSQYTLDYSPIPFLMKYM